MGTAPSILFSNKDKKTADAVLRRLSTYLRKEEGIYDVIDDPCLGILRLDYNYPPAPGDIDHPKSFGYRVVYRVVPGLTFQMCQSGVLSKQVQVDFIAAIRWLEQQKHVNAITGDCGFMFWFQELARKHARVPVLLSSLVQLPTITSTLAPQWQIAVFTANSCTLDPMHELIAATCGVQVTDNRYVIVGCQDVPGFEAVERGEKVNVRSVQPGIVALAQETIANHPAIRAILLECTELPPYADALRYATGLPVYDAITCSDMAIDGYLDNPRFGLDGWMRKFDGKQHRYKLGIELSADDKIKCTNCGANLVKESKWYKPF